MAEKLRANVLANLAFYRRSRLLLAFTIAFLVLTGLTSLPPLFGNSGVQRFNTLNSIFSQVNTYLLLLAGGLGLFVISSHLRSRSLKMVFTKPCSPALWLASAFAAAAAVSLLMNAVVLASAVALSYGWHLPVRPGLIFISADTFAASLGIIAYLMLLAMLVHPAVAATVVLIFNADTFYYAEVWAQATLRTGHSGWFLRTLEHIFHFLYLALPMIYAYGKHTEGIYSGLRVMHGEWKYLLYSFGYAVSLSVLCYLVALFTLQKKSPI